MLVNAALARIGQRFCKPQVNGAKSSNDNDLRDPPTSTVTYLCDSQADVQTVIDTWDALPPEVQMSIITLVQATAGEKAARP